MPVQRLITSAMSSSSTSSLSRRAPSRCESAASSAARSFSSCGERAVSQLGGAIEIVLALGLFDLHFRLFDLLAQRAQLRRPRSSPLPTARAASFARSRSSASSFSSCSRRCTARAVVLLAQRFALDFELHDAAR